MENHGFTGTSPRGIPARMITTGPAISGANIVEGAVIISSRWVIMPDSLPVFPARDRLQWKKKKQVMLGRVEDLKEGNGAGASVY